MFLTSPTYLRGFEGLKIPEYAINNMYITFFGKRMALFTISTPINGTNSYSGGQSQGPLEALAAQTNVHGGYYDFLKYPRDLESSTRSHVVLFTIKEINPLTMDQLKNYLNEAGSNISKYTKKQLENFSADNVLNAVGSAGQAAAAYAVDLATDPVETAKKSKEFVGQQIEQQYGNLGDKVTKSAETFNEKLSDFRRMASQRRTITKGYIALYMPENVSFSYDPEYDSGQTLAGVVGAAPLIGPVVSRITNVFENQAAKFLLERAGYVFNPEAQVLFNGINFRSFSMNFTFTPYSKKEAEEVKRIIKLFRTHAAPRRTSAVGGMFFIPPSIFNIDFKFNGSDNNYLNKVTDCVIENIDVNYTPNGWSAHEDGAPVQTTVTIQFKEIVLVDREMIEKQGY